ncbi:cytochrome P450 monooxygenase TRI13 [Colletotrichum spaethianum]|uniref:Cytochrome P450 monooxygenase TRI13 n=1 Tax=Colletotrichum spaethianum TaxID=700344 RepID=A0AA37LAI2_9PEZI|nr:cytochrome P450 monooxygenase TRI13 [Colletotrichum spaethianum]GKT43020.1 cytochrome P450 monooxygenase TRI13 [Colletotrichum spaethianum]
MAGFSPIAAMVVMAAMALRFVYIRLLPKPIAGIPHNQDSATRLLGDARYFEEIIEAGDFWVKFLTDLLARHRTPIAQFFPGPFAAATVVIGDYREARDLMAKRSKELGRGYSNNAVWHGVLPEHFIAMDDFHPSFKDARFLTKDLMTPSFLHEIIDVNQVSALASYKAVKNFIKLWKVKATMAKGLPFDAVEDLEGFTYDIMMTAAFGIPEEEGHTTERLRAVQSTKDANACGDGPLQVAEFQPIMKPALLTALHTLNAQIAGAFDSTIPKLYYFINNLRPSVRHAFRAKRSAIQHHINRSVEKLAHSGSKQDFASAVDYVVYREKSAAESAGRRPTFDSLRMSDMLWGYLVGGQDSTHSTLCFAMKYLGANQDAQAKLRELLRLAYPTANEQQREPTIEEIIKTQVPFLDAFIEETLRMCSPASAILKEALCDMTVLGHVIPKGTQIMFLLTGPTLTEAGVSWKGMEHDETSQKVPSEGINDWSLSRFPPQEFHAERWLQTNDDGETNFNKNAGPFISFSSGPRGCWGKRLAYMELKLIITLLIWNLEFSQLPAELEDNGLVEGIFTKPKSCLVKLKSISDTD